MSKIDDLIKELCPNGVIIKELIEVAELVMGTSPSGSTISNKKEIGIEFHQGKTYFGSEFIKCSNLYTSKPIKFALENSIILSVRAPVGSSNFTNRKISIGRGLASLTGGENLLTRFLYYFLNENIQLLKNRSNGSTFEAINTNNIKSLPIPVPPLAIQEKIVEILDKFTRLEAELEAELEARKAQYSFYRNQLLAFENKKVEWKSLGEIGTFTRGKRFVKTDMIEEGFPCLHYGEMYTHYNIFATESKSFISPELAKKLRVANPGDVVIVSAGETIEDIGKGTAWFGDSDIVTHDACFAFKSPLNPKYVSYFLRTRLFHDQIKKHISSGKISSINAKGLAKAEIPVPSMEEQERIVKILDKFDALVNDISIGLPAEIKARRQQYEYYREKLLTFKCLNQN